MEEGPKMRRVKRVIKKKDDAKKEEMRKEGEEYLKSKAMAEEEIKERGREVAKVGPSVGEKQEERVAKVVASSPSVSDAGLDEGLSMEEESVLARERLTEKEKLVMSAVLSNRRSRSRSNSRMGERIQESPLPRAFLESPVPTASGSSCTSSLAGGSPLPGPESPTASPLPLVAEEQVDISSSQEALSTARINPKPGQNRKTSAETATDILSGSNVVRRDDQSGFGKNPDPADNHSPGRAKNGHDAGGKCLIGKEVRPDDVIIAAEKNKAPEKLRKEDPSKEIPQRRSTVEENNNNNNKFTKEANKGNVVVDVVRPKRQNVTKEPESKRGSNGNLKEEKTAPAVPKEEEENTVVEEIRDSVKDVRDILARLSKKEEEEEVRENIEEESVSALTDNAAEKSKECPVKNKEDKMENVSEVPFLLGETAVDNIADLDFDKVKEHLLAEEKATLSLRQKMETIKRQPSPASHQVRHKDLDLGGSRVACPELKETPTSAIGLTGKVEKVEEEVRKVEATPGKRPTLQNADDGRTAPPAAPTKAAREKITAEEAEKQKLSRSQNNGRQDLGKSENTRQGSGHNGIAKTAITEKPKPEPTKPSPQKTAAEKPDVKTAPWRQGRSGQQGEVKEKIVKGSKRQEQEAKVQEFLRDPNAPPGSSSVPLEVRLRKPGVEKEVEDIIEVGADLLLAPHSILARPDLTKLLDSHRVISVMEASVSRTSLHLPPKIQHTHLKVPMGGLDSSAFTSMSKSAVGGRQLVVCSDGLGSGALLCAARLVKVKGLTVEKALADVTCARRCNVPAGLRLQLEEWASPPSSSMISAASLASLLASWLPLLVVALLLGLAWRQLTITVEENHRREEALTPYSYFQILKWP